MLTFSTRPLRWPAVRGVLAGSLGLPVGGPAPARADPLERLLGALDVA